MDRIREPNRNSKNVVVLAVCQVLFNSGRTLAFIAASLAAISMLGDDLTFVTAPITMMLVGTAAGTLPSAHLMRAWGRKWGFVIGAIIGAIGSAVAAIAVGRGHRFGHRRGKTRRAGPGPPGRTTRRRRW